MILGTDDEILWMIIMSMRILIFSPFPSILFWTRDSPTLSFLILPLSWSKFLFILFIDVLFGEKKEEREE